MKKNWSFPVLPVICFIAVLALGCGGDDDPTTASCDDGINDYEAALNAYIADITSVSKCNALKASLSDLVSCPGLTAGQKKEYQDEVDAIDCD
jgi:hypothetical protein